MEHIAIITKFVSPIQSCLTTNTYSARHGLDGAAELVREHLARPFAVSVTVHVVDDEGNAWTSTIKA